MSEAAEHRPRDCAQYHARAKSQPGLGTGRYGKGQSDHAKDGNRPGVHDRSPADCRTNGRVWQSSPSATFQHWGRALLCRFEPGEPSLKSNTAALRLHDRSVGSRGSTFRAISNLSSPNLTVPRLAGRSEANCQISISVAFLPQKIAPAARAPTEKGRKHLLKVSG